MCIDMKSPDLIELQLVGTAVVGAGEMGVFVGVDVGGKVGD